MLPAIILAAGDSVRMGSPKALLPDRDGRPFVARIARTLAAAGVDSLIIVTGRQHAAITAAIDADAPPLRPRLVVNPDPDRGQLSSLWVAMDALAGQKADGLMMTLVDVPLVRETTVRTVIDEWRRTRAPIVRPAVGERRGHPVIFDVALFDELRAAPLDQGAKVVVRAHASEILEVPSDDPGSIVDMDTPADYERFRSS